MKLRDLYRGDLSPSAAAKLDEDVDGVVEKLTAEIEEGAWSEKQKEVILRGIVPVIALYRVLLGYEIDGRQARNLVAKYVAHRVEKGNRKLKNLSRLPGFSKMFRDKAKKELAVVEVLRSDIVVNEKKTLHIDVRECLCMNACDTFGCAELCQVFCYGDRVLFDNIKKIQLDRSQTLGARGDKCDFRFTFK